MVVVFIKMLTCKSLPNVYSKHSCLEKGKKLKEVILSSKKHKKP